MKKKAIAVLLILLLVCSVTDGTSAFFISTQRATNVITAGGIQVELQEWADEDGTAFEDVMHVLPGHKITKIVTVRNTGPNAAWVRMSVKKSVQLAEGVTGETDLSQVELDLNTADWTEQGDWYYYKQPLAPGKTGKPLFTTVSFAEDMSNVWQKSTVTIDVEVQAVQTANNGEDVLEAAGWPEG
ncbi:MAG: hypothetical protein E7442_06295 [Ruminococcaceae bacterium]|nr:hypothetical protein [Oscillospiraceae bacterium]